METFLQYAVICPLVMLAGFVDAIAGGGGLISLPGYLLSGKDDAIGDVPTWPMPSKIRSNIDFK